MKKFIALVMTAICLLAVGCSKQEENQVIDVIVPNTPEAVVTPAPTPETPAETPAPAYVSPYTQEIADLKAKNPDCIGWIKIPGTNIDYPIMYGKNWYYSNHDTSKKESTSGSVYSHYDMAGYESYKTEQNIVVTAHNARVSKTMFHQLHHIQEVNLGKEKCAYKKCAEKLDASTLPNFSTEAGRIWDISVCGIDAQWEVWAMYEVDKNEPESTLFYNTWYAPAGEKYVPQNAEEIQKWIDKQLERTEYKFNVTPGTSDQFLTIYTCGDNHDSDTAQSRLYFFLRQVNPASTKFGGTAAATETTPAA